MSKRSIVTALTVLGVLVAAAPAEAVLRASGELRRISSTRYELVIRNTGDESFDGLTFTAVRGVDLSDYFSESRDERCPGVFYVPDGRTASTANSPSLQDPRTRSASLPIARTPPARVERWT